MYYFNPLAIGIAFAYTGSINGLCGLAFAGGNCRGSTDDVPCDAYRHCGNGGYAGCAFGSCCLFNPSSTIL
jgi:hypothetical protein